MEYSGIANYAAEKKMGIHLRAMALYRGIAGDPGGVRKFASSLGAVCLTVMLCLKSSGNEICPGSRFRSYLAR